MPNTLVHFEIAANDPIAVGRFYADLFGWKITKAPMPGADYWLVQTAKPGKGVNGGIMRRTAPDQRVINYVQVQGIDRFIQRVGQLGGQITMQKTEVPNVGYVAGGLDPDGNPFGLFEPPPPQPKRSARTAKPRKAARAKARAKRPKRPARGR